MLSKYTQLPAITGKQLIRLLQKDGWTILRTAKHGVALTKTFNDCNRVTIIPDTRASLPEGTLVDILSFKQTGIKKKGLRDLIDKYGL